MAKNNTKTRKVGTRRYRDAGTGRFVTKKYAKKNRKTTIKEPLSPSQVQPIHLSLTTSAS